MRPYRSKIRRVTTCTECHRRKQKCNRQTPCNICTERGVPSRCVYPGLSIGQKISEENAASSDGPVASTVGDKVDLDLSLQIGYSYNGSFQEQSPGLNELSNNSRAFSSATPGHVVAPQWKKLERLVANLPSPAIICELLNVFFSEANWYFSVLDRFYFDRAHHAWLQCRDAIAASAEKNVAARSLYFPALLFQVLALGVQFVPTESMLEKELLLSSHRSLDELSAHLSDSGEKILNILGRHIHAIAAIQADLMRCAWLKNCGRGAEAWYSLGNAVRQAQDQKLHLEPRPHEVGDSTEELQTTWYYEHRRRLWACLFTWESHMALQLGRPRMINAEDCTVNAPIDSDFPENPSRTLFVVAAPDEKPSYYTSQRMKYYLAQKIHKLMSLGMLKPGFREYTAIQSVHAEVIQFLGDLPPAMRSENPDVSWDLQYPEIIKHRLQISIIVHSFLLALHRPHAAQHPHSLESAMSAAIQVLDTTQLLFERTPQHQYKMYTLIFYTIDAGLLLAAVLSTIPSGEKIPKHAVAALRQAVIRLSVLKRRNSAAAAGERALNECLEKLGYASDNAHAEPTNPDSQAKAQQCLSQTADYGSFNLVPQAGLPTAYSPFAFAQQTSDRHDLFAQIMDDSGYTASWLEQMNSISSLNFDLEQDLFDWNSDFPVT